MKSVLTPAMASYLYIVKYELPIVIKAFLGAADRWDFVLWRSETKYELCGGLNACRCCAGLFWSCAQNSVSASFYSCPAGGLRGVRVRGSDLEFCASDLIQQTLTSKIQTPTWSSGNKPHETRPRIQSKYHTRRKQDVWEQMCTIFRKTHLCEILFCVLQFMVH